jgi:hypothetical protein
VDLYAARRRFVFDAAHHRVLGDPITGKMNAMLFVAALGFPVASLVYLIGEPRVSDTVAVALPFVFGGARLYGWIGVGSMDASSSWPPYCSLSQRWSGWSRGPMEGAVGRVCRKRVRGHIGRKYDLFLEHGAARERSGSQFGD